MLDNPEKIPDDKKGRGNKKNQATKKRTGNVNGTPKTMKSFTVCNTFIRRTTINTTARL